jgi:superfamily II DNA or RNA helicase
MLDDTHIWIKNPPNISRLKNDLTITSKFADGPVITLYQERGDFLGVPRHFLNATDAEDRRVDGDLANLQVISACVKGQRELLDMFIDRHRDGNTGFLVSAPTGTGKTFLALKMLEHLNRTALVVVSKTDLLDQWVEEILKHTNFAREDIGIGLLGSVNWSGKKIVVSLVHTLAKDRWGAAFRNNFGVVVFDEVDRSVPPSTFNSVACMFPARYRIGMSATLTRPDGLDKIIEYHIGQTTLTMDHGKKMKSKVLIVPYISLYPIKYYKNATTMAKRSLFLKAIESDISRNMLVARYAWKFYQVPDRRVVIMSDRTKQLVNIKEILCGRYSIPAQDIGYYTQSLLIGFDKIKRKNISKSVPQEERDRAAESCRIILATYGMMGVGTNIPSLSGLIIASPHSSIVQAVGRIERFLAGKAQPIVVDIVDTNEDMAIGWHQMRLKEYKKQDLDIIVTKGVERNG